MLVIKSYSYCKHLISRMVNLSSEKRHSKVNRLQFSECPEYSSIIGKFIPLRLNLAVHPAQT